MKAKKPKPAKGKTFKRARDAVTGHFVSLAEAEKSPSTTVVERVKRKGCE